MLSAEHHVGFWLASAAARIVYETLVSKLRPEVLIVIMLISAARLLPIIAFGPPPAPQTPSQTRRHFVALGGLLTTMGVTMKAICDVSGTGAIAVAHERVVHILLAFTILGILEPIRQNRRDIEPCLDYFFGLERINPELTFAQHIFINGFELITYCGCQRALEHIVLVCGAHGLGADHYPILNPLNSARFAFYSGLLRAPLVDAAETIFFTTNREILPDWIPAPRRELLWPGESWTRKRVPIIRHHAGAVALFSSFSAAHQALAAAGVTMMLCGGGLIPLGF